MARKMMTVRLISVIVILIVTFDGNVLTYAADMPDVEEIMSAFEDTISKVQAVTQRCGFEAEIKTIVEGSLAPHAHRRETQNFVFYRDLNRFDVRREVLHYDNEGDVDKNKSSQYRLIVDEKQRLMSDGRLGEPPAFIFSTQASNRARIRAYRSLAEIRVLDGYLPGDETNSLSKILRSASSLRLRDSMDVVDGHEVYVMEAETLYGNYSLWIDPKYGFLPRRITVGKTGDDLLDGKPVNTPPRPLSPGQQPYYPHEPLREVSLLVNSIKIERIDNTFVPTACHIVYTLTYSSGKTVTFTKDNKRSDIDFDPDFDALNVFVMDAPNGTRVFHSVLSGPTMKCEWRDGKVVPIMDDQLIEMIDDTVRRTNVETAKQPETVGEETKLAEDESVSDLDATKETGSIEKEIAPPASIPTALIGTGIAGLLIVTGAVWLVLYRYKGKKSC